MLSIFKYYYLENPIYFRIIWKWHNFYKNNLNTFDSRLKYLDEYVKIGYIIAYLSSMYKDKLA